MGDGWTTVANFRELGGLETASGRRVRPGLLFRSGALNELSTCDQDRLLGLGVGAVFDLRSRDEATRQPDVVPAGVEYRRVSALQMLDEPSDDPIDLLDWDAFLRKALSGERSLSRLEAFQHGVYPEMARRPDAFRVLVRMLIDHPGRPTLFHCTAGKDRTGLAAAILLRLLEVPDAVIMADYLVSGQILAQKNLAAMQALRARVDDERVLALVEYMLGVTAGQLESAFAQMDVAFGSWDGFVREGLGLGAEDVAALREELLTR